MLNLSKFPVILAFVATPAALGSDQKACEVFDAEKAFARAGAERGIRESFLQFFADDSVVFAPAPTNGKAFYKEYKDKGYKLVWEPNFAAVAASGDLGVTTGPWHLEKSMTDSEILGYGEFASVWRRQPDKSWKVVLDLGIEHEKPSRPPPEPQLVSLETEKTESWGVAALQLEREETALFGTEDFTKALLQRASDDVRILRDGALPAIGKPDATALLSRHNGKVTRQRLRGGGISEAKDLAYCFGTYAEKDSPVKEQGYFLSVWRRDDRSGWRLLLDVQKREKE